MTDANILDDDIESLLVELRRAGIRLYLDGDALRVRGARESLTPKLTRRIQDFKPQLRVRLQAASAAPAAAERIPRRPEGVPVGLSFLQQNLWLIDQLEGSVHYNMAAALDLRGELDRSALERALRAIVERHESLRTVFREGGEGRPVQIVNDGAVLSVTWQDLLPMPVADREAAMERLAAIEAKTPFDLAHDLMLRATLIRLNADRHVLLITKHHIASDGWSMDVLLDEMCKLYEAYRDGLANPLPALPVQYADYSVWLTGWLQGAVLGDKLDYWARRLQGLPEVHALPLDRPRPPRRTIHGGRHARRFGAHHHDALMALCARCDVTLFTLLEAVFALLVSRWSGETDIAIATPISARTRPELASMIGYFTNTLVLRSDCDGARSFLDLLQGSRTMMLEAHDHHHVPFEMLVDRINPARSLAYNALVQLSFTLQNNRAATVGTIELPRLRIAPLRNDEHASVKFDLELTVRENADGLLARWNYNTDIFDRATIENMDRAFEALLDGVIEDPSRRLADYPIRTADDAQRIAGWNATDLPVDTEATLVSLVLRAVHASPLQVALVEGNRECSYGELDRRSNRLARVLASRYGIGAGDVVGVGMGRCIEMVVSLLAVIKTGAAYVPLDPSLPAERLLWMVGDCRAAALLSRAEEAVVFADLTGVPVLLADAFNEEGIDAALPDTLPSAGELAYVIYTSGSTGRPKGTLNLHRGVCNRIQGMQAQFNLGGSDRVLQKTPLSFDVSVSEIFWPLSAGATLVLAAHEGHRDPDYLARLLADRRITVAHFVPSMLHAFLRAHPAVSLPDLRYLLTSGEALSYELQAHCVQLFPHVRKYNHYGPTETAIEVTWWCFDKLRADRVVPIGRPTANVRTYIVDASDREQPVGVAGELCIAGVQVGEGYLNQPGLTAERFVDRTIAGKRERIYRTGDRARWLADGQIQYLGRLDGQIKLRGFRIETGEIESVLVEHARVAQAAVILWDGESTDRARLVAYVVPGGEGRVDAIGLRALLAAQLPEYMIPSQFIWLDALPSNASGKLDRRALPSPSQPVSTATDEPAATGTEATLLALYSELLGHAPRGVFGHFFELGGHSLLATQLASAIRSRFSVEMPLRVIFEHPVIRDLARWLDEQGPGGAVASIPRRADEPVLSFAQQRLWMLARLGNAASAYNIPRALLLRGNLDSDALSMAFAAIVERHEGLRLCFPTVDGEPRVRILPPFAALERIDLRALPAVERDIEVERLRHDHANWRFDLAEGPLFRAALLQTGSDEHVLLINLQHIVGDGWSIAVFMRELAALYAAFGEGRPSPLPLLPIQYTDYAAWQRQWLDGARMEAQLDFWRNRLADAPLLLGLPTDRPRPAVFSYRGSHRRAVLSAGLDAPLRRLAQRHGCTMYMTMLAAFQLLLARHSGEEDICVGTPIANREHPQTADLIGFFVNTLVMRGRVDPTEDFGSFLADTRRIALDAFQHQDLPFDRVVEAVRPARALAHGPLFQVMFRYENAGLAPHGLPGIDLQQLVADGSTAQCDLTLNIIEEGDGLHCEWEYASDLFDERTIALMQERLECLLRAIVDDDERGVMRPMGQLPLLGDDERRHVIGLADGLRMPATSSTTIHERFTEQAKATPRRVAVVHEGVELTYAELDRRSDAWASRLHASGVRAGSRVALVAPRGVDALVGVLATLKAGAVHLPLNPRHPPARLAMLYDDFAPTLVLTVSALASELAFGSATTLCLDEPCPDDALLVDTIDTHALAYVIYTSGSTGTPKGVLVEHAQVLHLWRALQYTVMQGIEDGSRVALNAELTFDAAWQGIVQLLSGHTLVIVPAAVRNDPAALRAFLDEQRIDVFDCTPAQLEPLLAVRGDLGVKRVLVGGEAISMSLWQRLAALPGSAVHNVYGPTECTVDSTFATVVGTAPTIGRPLPNVRAYVLDTFRQPVPVGVAGQLYVGGDGVARGYLDRSSLTAERFLADPFAVDGGRMYATGDLARWRADGTLEYIGRADHQVKLRGYRIEPGEIEARLSDCAGVHEALVMLREDVAGDTRLAAYVVPLNGQTPEPGDLRKALLAVLPEPMVPASFTILVAWPLTAHGKVDRRALPVPGVAAVAAAKFAAPDSDTERRVAAIWHDLLQVAPIGRDDNFFDLGGHSLAAVRVHEAVRASLASDISLTDVFQAATLAELAATIDRRSAGQS